LKLSALGFRYRSLIFLAICILGFTAPWDYALHLDGTGPNSHVWGQLAVLLSKGGALSIASAFNLLLVVGILCAFVGAWLRTWGSAYLGIDVMRDRKMRADEVVDHPSQQAGRGPRLADGPYRYVRNPLYLGMWFNALALALLMPVSGAIFMLVLAVAITIHTILREETFLRTQLGDTYIAYCAKVPRLLPALRPRIASSGAKSSGAKPRWPQAALAEIFMWGVLVSFLVLGWRYDAHLLIQCVLVWLGVSLVGRGFTMRQKPTE
jgi:protein-S-isoprenylcysteine O-methyltransferase Ste14